MEEVNTRHARIKVLYDGVDISTDIADMITDFQCTDHAGGKADDISISLEDRSRLWIGDWFPDKGAELTASIECFDFPNPGDVHTYPCGTYTIDDIQASGPPRRVRMQAVSSTVKSSLRREEKTRAWEHVSLEGVASEIAGQNNITCVYDAPAVMYQRKDQRNESDLGFLSRLADEAGLRLKAAERRIILFDGKAYDAKSPALTYLPGDVSAWNFSSQAHEVFSACKVDYFDPSAKQMLSYTFAPEGGPETGQTLKINKRVEDLAAAETLAMAELRKRNREEITGGFDSIGDPRLFASNTVMMDGFGVFTGTYFVEKVVHAYSKSGGYRTSVELKRTLDY
jgi:phage protein D